MSMEIGMLFKILVTVTAFGQPPFTEVLPREYPSMHIQQCLEAAMDIVARAHDGVTVTAECVPALTREI